MTDTHDSADSAADRSDSPSASSADRSSSAPSAPSASSASSADRPAADRPDPVLVRPYVKPAPAKPARGPADAPTVLQPAIVDDTEVLPVVTDQAPKRRGLARPLALRLLVLIGGTALALAVAGWLIFHPAPDTIQPGAALPEFRATLPADSGAGSARPSLSVSPSASTSTSVSPSASASASASSSPSASVSPSATLAPPPASDRTGAVKAASGRCLAMGGLLGLDGSPVQVTGCADLPAQKFTLATDGTLRVSGRCAQATADSTVHIAQCDDAASSQWRSGPARSLVNPATGRCLTDPGQLGATAHVAACTAAADQSWSLP
jgi:hypothetical protein